ncbi:Uncharacterised protein [uncultured archaeon]|nr:Uncharacterised protein [uncultured archaeon]
MNVTIIGLDHEVFSKDSIIKEAEAFFDNTLKKHLESLQFNFKTHDAKGKQRFELTLTGLYNGKQYHVSNLHDAESQWEINDSMKCVLRELKKIILREKEKTISQKKERDKTFEE